MVSSTNSSYEVVPLFIARHLHWMNPAVCGFIAPCSSSILIFPLNKNMRHTGIVSLRDLSYLDLMTQSALSILFMPLHGKYFVSFFHYLFHFYNLVYSQKQPFTLVLQRSVRFDCFQERQFCLLNIATYRSHSLAGLAQRAGCLSTSLFLLRVSCVLRP